jgi:hypothetical protein
VTADGTRAPRCLRAALGIEISLDVTGPDGVCNFTADQNRIVGITIASGEIHRLVAHDELHAQLRVAAVEPVKQR